MTHRLLALAVILGLALFAGGCGDDSNDSSSSSSEHAVAVGSRAGPRCVCDAKDKLATDVKGMKEDNTVAEYKASLTRSARTSRTW